MKLDRKTLLLLMAVLASAMIFTARGFAAPVIALDFQGGPLYSLTSLPDLIPAIQPGWNAKISGVIESRDVFLPPSESANPKKPFNIVFLGRFQVDIFGLNTSLPQSDGNLYRAWQGMGLSLLAGIRSNAFSIPFNINASVRAEAGAGLRATKYSGTGLVSANPAIIGQLGLDISIQEDFSFGLNLPVEFAWKSGGTSLKFGIDANFRYRFTAQQRNKGLKI